MARLSTKSVRGVRPGGGFLELFALSAAGFAVLGFAHEPDAHNFNDFGVVAS
jgi:hypothetical protein